MGKSVPSRPPTFQECDFCHKEFGSRSLELHLARCPERDGHVEQVMQPLKRLSLDEEIEINLSDDLTQSWPSRKQSQRRVRRKRRESVWRAERPKTAVLMHPAILDETLKDKIDMTLTKKQFLAALKLCNDNVVSQRPIPVMRKKWAPVGFKRDPQGPRLPSRRVRNRTSPISEYRSRQDQIYGRSTKIPLHINRPRTSTVNKPVIKQVDLPTIELPNPALKVKAKMKAKNAKKIDKPDEKVPEPCRSCGRSDLPERFHTHPPLEASRSEGSKIPIRLYSPPKKITSLEDQLKPDDGSQDKPNKARTRKTDKRSRSPKKPLKSLEDPGHSLQALHNQRSLDRVSLTDDSDNTVSTSSNISSGSTGVTSSKSQTHVTCSICGRQFGKNSFRFHEPQCQKKQQALKEKQEKEMLEEKRTNSYYIDPSPDDNSYDGTFDAIWEAHVQQLVACSKCSRTFFPDRIEVHERNCKGTAVNLKASPTKVSSISSPNLAEIIKESVDEVGQQDAPPHETLSPSPASSPSKWNENNDNGQTDQD
ncbi:hypothetical protein TCAL_02938 [Tigriopus californicus]|uniref:C2HC/C3H-type domain-containing protein n=1 Tax=Tigriopus californicus TaxID=6832 RepID=A0A553NPA8_TIGCA|nr:uncharacterized protein LOC131878761 [Tigriopus californicus]XP_059080856.1 uncharacterized protein LOC131878761 [Tigriopus californicus]TRY67253.1 hypothetical protein TCAL_02938 [Tigriopus californicus]|eukprot:TCALIF_02938-PA protein Name:"Similar to ZNF474 Zinc finger protein 474 (Bos taurus)" AED:0.07 eAED:0.07 QI:271/1/0.75/1/0.66/0.5/4/0/534